MITLICDTPTCPRAGQFESVEDADEQGWGVAIDTSGEMPADFCPGCFEAWQRGEKPGPVLLDRQVAQDILGMLCLIQNQYYVGTLIIALKEAIGE